ncbi:MAG: hypothetical protein ABI746_02765, partial [Dermatophilaceae bacterium]
EPAQAAPPPPPEQEPAQAAPPPPPEQEPAQAAPPPPPERIQPTPSQTDEDATKGRVRRWLTRRDRGA